MTAHQLMWIFAAAIAVLVIVGLFSRLLPWFTVAGLFLLLFGASFPAHVDRSHWEDADTFYRLHPWLVDLRWWFLIAAVMTALIGVWRRLADK